jgi:hypothetical protein
MFSFSEVMVALKVATLLVGYGKQWQCQDL